MLQVNFLVSIMMLEQQATDDLQAQFEEYQETDAARHKLIQVSPNRRTC